MFKRTNVIEPLLYFMIFVKYIRL